MKKQTKITYFLFGLTVVSVLLHNAVSGYLKTEEPVFFILSFVFGLGFVVSVIWNLILGLRRRKLTDN